MTSSSDNADQINFIILAQSRDCLVEQILDGLMKLSKEERNAILSKHFERYGEQL